MNPGNGADTAMTSGRGKSRAMGVALTPVAVGAGDADVPVCLGMQATTRRRTSRYRPRDVMGRDYRSFFRGEVL
jgi:hypothetical protein